MAARVWLQDKVKKRTKELNPEAGEKPVPTMHESMLWTNFSGFLVACALAVCTGQATEGVAFCMRNPEVINAIMIYSLASAVGQNFIYCKLTPPLAAISPSELPTIWSADRPDCPVTSPSLMRCTNWMVTARWRRDAETITCTHQISR